MQIAQSKDNRGKRLWGYLVLNCIIWGLIILPILGQVFWEFPYSAFSCFFGILFALLLSIYPMKLGRNSPPQGKEYQILLYPLISIPIVILSSVIHELLMSWAVWIIHTALQLTETDAVNRTGEFNRYLILEFRWPESVNNTRCKLYFPENSGSYYKP